MTPADRDRFEKCLALAAQGATPGERAAARAAAERIAAGAGLTLTEAMRVVRPARPDPSPRSAPRAAPQRAYAWAQPKEPVTPITVEELLRQKAETEAWRKRAAARAKRRSRQAQPDQESYAAEQRARQAERDRAWAEARAGAADDA